MAFTQTGSPPLPYRVLNSLNNKKPVIRTVPIYLSIAFDTVNNEVLLHNINALDLNKYM